MSRRHLLFLAVISAVPTVNAFAQTSDTWGTDVGTAGGSWSVASNWAHGVIPDGGGTASFTTLPTFTSAPLSIWQDLSTVTLSKVTFDSQITYLVKPPAAAPTNSITLSGGASLDTPIPSINTISTTTFGQQFQIVVTGGAGLTKTGPGTVTLWGNTNTFTGGTRVNGGVLVARQIGDGAFGNAASSISLDGGTIRVTTTAWTSSRQIAVNSGGGTIEATTTGATTFNGAVTGAGNLYKTGSRGLNLFAANSFVGETQVLAGSLNLAGSGALNNTTAVSVRDVLILDNSGSNVTNRVNDSAPVLFQGANLTFTGNASAASSEGFGTTTFSRGTTTVTATAGTGQSASLALGSVSRDTGGAVFFRGSALGSTLGANTTNITFGTAPTLVGGGGTTPTNVSIIPWAYGNATAAAALNAATNSFVTYGANGVRPLDIATEYAATIGAAAATDNVRITASEAVNASTTVNSLLIGAGGAITGSGTINITSGALLNLATNTTIAPSIDFGAAEGMIIAPASITFGGLIAGSGGLTKQGAGIATFAAANTYSGITTIGGGTALFTSSVASAAPSAFGNSTTAIVLAPAGTGTGGTTARLSYAGASAATLDRNLNVTGRVALNNAAILPGFGVSTAQSLTMNGSINLDGSPLSLLGVAGSTLILNGEITGNGGPLTDSQSTTSSTIQINGNNSFSGGAEMHSAIWQIGSDAALGSGMLKMTQTSGQPTIQAVGGPRIVPNPAVSFSFSANYWQISGGQDITFTGSINLSGSYTHNINNSALTTYAGVLHTGGFTKAGTGTLVLSGNNIYTGSTTISTGVLRVTNSNALGSVQAPTIVASGAMLELRNNALTGEPVSIAGTGISGLGAIDSSSGSNSVGAVTLTAAAAMGVEAGGLTAGNIEGGAFNLNKVGAGTLTANRVRVGALSVDAGQLNIAPGRNASKTSTATSLSINPAASMDLGDNDLQVNYSGASPVSTIQSYLQSGYNAGSWNGAGLNSSVAKVVANTALGYSDSGTQVLVTYTLAGDADLDRKVNTLDFNQLAGSFGTVTGAFWKDGDFNYDGAVDSVDFGLLSGAYGSAMPTSASLGSVVPEPAMLGFASLAGLLTRRRH